MALTSDQPTHIRTGEELATDQLITFLQRQLPDFPDEIKVSQFPSGFSNLTYLIAAGNQEWVLRKPPLGAKVKSGHDMGREFRILSALEKVYPKVPRPLLFCEDESVLGSPFYLMERVKGIIIRKANGKHIPAADYQLIAQAWMENMVALHQVDYHAAGLQSLGRPEGYVARQVDGWTQRYLKAKTHEVAEIEKLAAWLAANQPQNQHHPGIIHNDYKYDNIVFEPGSWHTILAVLDWEMATLGDPLMDLGTSLGYWVNQDDPPFMHDLSVLPTYLPGNPSRSQVADMYTQMSGLSVDIKDLVFYYAYGLFKLTVVVQQIYFRYAKGLTQDPRFSKFDQAAKAFSTMALQAIAKKRLDQLF